MHYSIEIELGKFKLRLTQKAIWTICTAAIIIAAWVSGDEFIYELIKEAFYRALTS